MAQNREHAGVILYIMQEGRGIGLVNKLRAYDLQKQGLDTVDANIALGFNDDERSFLPAKLMLEKLNIDNIKLLTNNPKKSTSLADAGIKIYSTERIEARSNKINSRYLETKIKKMAHLLTLDGF
jgi:GTP cyclohydrolase II